MAAGNVPLVDAVTDVYGLGAILYETLTGRPPFRGETLLETLLQVQKDDPVRPSRLRRNLPRDLETICLKCLEKDRGKRYQSAAELADRLRLFLDGKPIPDRATSTWERAVKWCRRRPALAAFLAAGSLALVLLVSFTVALVWALIKDADVAERELKRIQQTEESRKTIGASLGAASELIKEEKWLSAEGKLDVADELVQAEPSLRDAFADQIGKLRGAIRAGKQQQQAREASHEKYRRFKGLLDQALFHTSTAGSLEVPGSLAAARSAALEALAVFQMDAAGATAAVLNAAHFQQAERDGIAVDCYVLLLTLAEVTVQEQKAAEALRLLDRASRMPPGRTPAYHLCLAHCLTALGRTDDAKKERQAARDGRPTTAADHFLLGSLAYHEKHLPKALDHFKDALNKQPEHFWANFSVAVCSLRLGRLEQAESHLTVCQGLKTDFAWTRILRGFVRGGLGANARVRGAAAKHLADAEADFEEAKTLLRKRPDREAEYVLLVNRGGVRTLHRDYDRAIADLGKAIEMNGDLFHAHWALASALHAREQARFLLQQSGRLLAATPLGPLPLLLPPPKHAEALAQLDRAIARKPELASLYYSRGQLRVERGEAPAALKDFEKVIRLYGDATLTFREKGELADAYLERGRHLYRLNDYDKALQAFEKAQRLRPGLKYVHLSRAGALTKLRQHADAVRAYDTYLLSGGNPLPHVFEGRGLCRLKLEDHQGAIADFTKALGLQPPSEDRARLHVQRGWSHLRRRNVEAAEKDFEQALDLVPRSADAHAGLGFVWVRRDRHTALAHAQAALDLEPDEWAIAYKAADLLTRLARRIPERTGELPLRKERAVYVERALDLLGAVLAQAPPAERPRLWREINSDLRAVLAGRRFEALTRTYPQLPEK
jgi:tetratricopeptide (TPR) repeat protein